MRLDVELALVHEAIELDRVGIAGPRFDLAEPAATAERLGPIRGNWHLGSRQLASGNRAAAKTEPGEDERNSTDLTHGPRE